MALYARCVICGRRKATFNLKYRPEKGGLVCKQCGGATGNVQKTQAAESSR